MISFLGGDDWGVGGEREVDTWVGYQVGLELCQVNIEGTIKSEGGCDRGHNLTNQSVQVGVARSLNVQVPAADIVDGLVVDHEGTVRVFQSGMGGQDGVVWLNNSGGNLGCWVDGEFELRFLTIVNTQPFHKQRGEA